MQKVTAMSRLEEITAEGVFIITEVGCNFEGDFGRAVEMVHATADAGADAVKFQTFVAERLASRSAEKFWEIEGCPGRTQLDEFRQMPSLSADEYLRLKETAEKRGLVFFSTPSDEGSADLLEEVGVEMYKISSMDITHLPLLRHVARKGRPVIISTGASTVGEIDEALRVMADEGNTDVAVLHCTSNYPTEDRNVNLRMISHLKEVFPHVPVGYSDHTLPEDGEGIIASAVALGARIIEKHFTFDNTRPGYDHEISVDYQGLTRLVRQVRRVEEALGEAFKRPVESEARARLHARRSIVAAVSIPRGAVLTREMLAIKRPGTGIEPRFLDVVVGRTASTSIEEDAVITWEML